MFQTQTPEKAILPRKSVSQKLPNPAWDHAKSQISAGKSRLFLLVRQESVWVCVCSQTLGQQIHTFFNADSFLHALRRDSAFLCVKKLFFSRERRKWLLHFLCHKKNAKLPSALLGQPVLFEAMLRSEGWYSETQSSVPGWWNEQSQGLLVCRIIIKLCVTIGVPWLGFSHRWCGVKILTRNQERTGPLFGGSPLVVMLNLMPMRQKFDVRVKNSDAAQPVWKPLINLSSVVLSRCAKYEQPSSASNSFDRHIWSRKILNIKFKMSEIHCCCGKWWTQ